MLIIDRFEQDFAIVEDGDTMIEIPRARIAASAREGDVILPTQNGDYIVDAAATGQRAARIKALMDRLWQ